MEACGPAFHEYRAGAASAGREAVRALQPAAGRAGLGLSLPACDEEAGLDSFFQAQFPRACVFCLCSGMLTVSD